jgi:hypothetical protein
VVTTTTITMVQVTLMDMGAMQQYNLILSQKIDHSQMTRVQGQLADTDLLLIPCSQLTMR